MTLHQPSISAEPGLGTMGVRFLLEPQETGSGTFFINDSVINGMSHLYYLNNKYEHYRISGIYHSMDLTIYFKEDSTIAVARCFFIELFRIIE